MRPLTSALVSSVLANILFVVYYSKSSSKNNTASLIAAPSTTHRELLSIDPKTIISKVSSDGPYIRTEYDKFQGVHPSFSDFCNIHSIGRGPGKYDSKGSQFDQDAFLYQNFFAGKKDGFFLDIGANHPLIYSNSLFFDQCLGWKGLAFEPNPQYLQAWETPGIRTTELHPNCIWKETKDMHFKGGGVTGGITEIDGQGTWTAHCLSLEDVLDAHRDKHIDFISLDIEGAEIDLLQNFPFYKYDIGVWLVETFWLDARKIDHIFMTNGYYKVAQLAIDSVYVKATDTIWYPEMEQQSHWPQNENFMDKVVQTCFGGKRINQCPAPAP